MSPRHRDGARAARHRIGRLAALVLGIALVASGPASAKVVLSPWSGNIAFVSSKSVAGGMEDLQTTGPSGPAPWSGMPISSVDNDTTGASAFAFFTLATSFNDSVFAASSGGTGSTDGAGAYNRGGTLVYVLFVIERTQSYINYPIFTPGNFGTAHTLAFLANMESKHLAVVPLVPGETHTARLAPGVYCYYFENYYRDESFNGNSNSVSSQVSFQDVPDPLIDQHPQSQTVAPGATASFSVGASGIAHASAAATSPSAPSALTYQWRRNYQNLVNGGRISGATTSQLQITNVAVAPDTGTYDCVVTQNGVIHEPSSLARLTVTGTTDVGDPPAGLGVSLAVPAPSPFASRTRLRFALPAEAEVTLDVLDVGGRRVRTLVRGERRAAGTHAIEWDGRGDGGDRTPSGVYFVRLFAGHEQRVQRVVRIVP
ncbi:MAG TPA: FlgD immunoglobulin-like domain containing protein [Gemmatimonadales bacterium]|nr:FlgD immunoglobulin-like domain containing protein [Gemmatimonadales bacterium]